MKMSERIQIIGEIMRAQSLLENLRARAVTGGRPAKNKDLTDWQALQTISTQQVARMLNPEPSVTPPELPLAPAKEA